MGYVKILGEAVPYLSEYVCQIWLRSDGRVEKKGDTDRQTDKGTLQFYISEGTLNIHGKVDAPSAVK